MNYYSIEYDSEKQTVMFIRILDSLHPQCLQKWSLHFSLQMMKTLLAKVDKNFSGSTVMLQNLGSKKVIERTCNKYKCRSVDLNKCKQ